MAASIENNFKYAAPLAVSFPHIDITTVLTGYIAQTRDDSKLSA